MYIALKLGVFMNIVVKLSVLSLLIFNMSCSKLLKSDKKAKNRLSYKSKVNSDFLVDTNLYEDKNDGSYAMKYGGQYFDDKDVTSAKSIGRNRGRSSASYERKRFVHKPIGPLQTTGEKEVYTAESGDTLMFIAYKIYGNYLRWRDIAKVNPGLNYDNLKAGDKVSFLVPVESFDWIKNGEPHLIQWGDSLTSISKQKYGTSKKWKKIYENNKQMIQFPDLIFAGFTLYYTDGNEREVASQF